MRRPAVAGLVLRLLLVMAGSAGAGFENGPEDPPGPVQRLQLVFAAAYEDAEDQPVALREDVLLRCQ